MNSWPSHLWYWSWNNFDWCHLVDPNVLTKLIDFVWSPPLLITNLPLIDAFFKNKASTVLFEVNTQRTLQNLYFLSWVSCFVVSLISTDACNLSYSLMLKLIIQTPLVSPSACLYLQEIAYQLSLLILQINFPLIWHSVFCCFYHIQAFLPIY